MKKLMLLIISLVYLQMSAQTTTFNISRSISCTDTIRPFGTNINSYGLSIEGRCQMLSDTAFVRVVLVDNNGREWLVYECNSLYSTEESGRFQDAAFETTALYNITPSSIIVTVCDANIFFANIKSNGSFMDRNVVASVSDSVFLAKNLQIVERINAKLSAHKKAWRADTTFLSNLRYQDKKALFGNHLPNLQGWDYYAYGYYSPLNDNTPQASDNIVKEFDWRTRHGSQNTGSYYYNPDGSGWIPKWRYGQGANDPDCWAFSVLYSTESMVNLYFNQQINDELSVQDILSCSGGESPSGGGYVDSALLYVAQEGVVDEDCLHYMTWLEVPCEYKCSNPSEKVKIGGYSSQLLGEELIKSKIITKGPLVSKVLGWGHAMSMVGFGVVKAGDPILYGNFNAGTSHDFIVEADSPDIGKPFYVFKQSYATYGYNHSHFCNVILDANSGSRLKCIAIDTPITSMLYNNSDIVCVDNDGDGYYNWGIGPKPATCPNCPDEEDCDDSSPLIGPYNETFECIVLCENYDYSLTPEYITDNELWGSETYKDHDVIVEDGGVLTIENTVCMGDSTKIIVKPGGKLILDYGAVLTGMCGNMWQGIEVWGNSSMHQSSDYQGYLELKNGAVIENAKCAVQLWRPNYWTTTGGIIHATDATFRNNAMSVKAVNYTNFNPGSHHETSYNAYFRNCTFVVNSGYLGTETFNKHVGLAVVNGIKFSGCDFSADRSVDGVHQYCIGISAYDAGFTVTSPCTSLLQPCPEEDLDHSTFTGLCAGIRASSDGLHPRSFIVRDAVFNNNDYGIHAVNTDYPTIVGNDFSIGGGDYCDYNYGVLLDNVTGFCIEENDFHPSQITGSTKVGLAVYHSNGINDVYRNMFKGLSGGSLALGQNTNVSGTSPGGTVQGLTYTCNEFAGNVMDVMVLQRDGAGDIQPQQGSSATPAGNTFASSNFQIHNEGTHQIDYHYNSSEPDETPDISKLYRVNRQGTTNTNACASHYGNSPVTKSPSEKAALEADYLSAYSNFTSLRNLYESRIDGGNTNAQVADISGATAADMWQLRAQLLGLSPYVSRHVLNAAADRDDVFSDPVLFEILAANPDELKNDSLISYLESKANPLPAYMVELLRQMASGTSARTALVAQMDKYGHDFTMAAGDIVRSNLGDSVSNPTELRQWLGNMNDIAADRMAVSSYLQEGDSANAFALANMLPALYGLQGDQLADHCDYMRLIQLYQALYSSGRTVFEMSAAERAMVGSIAENGAGVSQSMAEVLMEQVTGGCEGFCFYPGLPEAGDGGKGGRLYPDDAINKAVGLSTNVGPNPATTWTTVNYVLPGNGAKALLSLTNSLGVTVYSTELDGATGSKVIDLRGLAAGVYVYTIRYNQYVETGKLVISK